MNERYGIYFNNMRIWSNFKSEQQAYDFIELYDLEQQYEVRSY